MIKITIIAEYRFFLILTSTYQSSLINRLERNESHLYSLIVLKDVSESPKIFSTRLS